MITQTPLEETLLQLIEPMATELGYEIVRIRMLSGSRQTLQIMAETFDGKMGSSDCEKLSRNISPILEAHDPISAEYNLEVSSPGIDRPLTRLKDFERWANHRAKLELDRAVENQRRFSGEIVGIEAESVAIDLDGETETALIPFAWINSAKLILTDELIRASLNKRGKSDELDEIETAIDDGKLQLESPPNVELEDPQSADN